MEIMMKNILILITIMMYSMISHAEDTGIPVKNPEVKAAVDVVAGINGLILEITGSQHAVLVNQNAQLKKLISILSGSNSYGDMANSIQEKDARRYAPANWEDSLKILNSGGTLGNFTASSGKSAYTLNDDNARLHDVNLNTAAASNYISENSYNQTETRLKNVEKLMTEIDKATDLKQAIDLNNRLSAENAIALAEVIRLQSVLLNLKTNRLQNTNTIVSNEAKLIQY